MSAQWVVKFNGAPVQFGLSSRFAAKARKIFRLVGAREASAFPDEASGWAAVREYGVGPLPLVTVEAR